MSTIAEQIRKQMNTSLGLEAADEEGAQDDAPIATGDESETASAAIMEAQQEEAEIEADDRTADEIEDDQEATEDIAEGVRVSVESGGLDNQAAYFTKIALANTVGKYIDINTIVPSMEEWGGSSSQMSSTNLTLEAVTESLKAFWETVKKQFNKIWVKLVDWLKSIFGAAPRLKSRAQKLQKRADETTGSPKEKSFELSGAKAISVGGKVTKASALAAWAGISKDLKSELDGESAKETERAGKEAAKGIEGLDGTNTAKAAAALKGTYGCLQKVADEIVKDKGASKLGDKEARRFASGDADVYLTKELIGGKAYVVVIPTNSGEFGAEAAGNLRLFRLDIVDHKAKASEAKVGKVETLSPGEVAKLCEDVIHVCEVVSGYEKIWPQRDAAKKSLESALDSVVKKVDGRDKLSATDQRMIRSVATNTVGFLRKSARFDSQCISFALSTASAMLTYGERSLSQYKG